MAIEPVRRRPGDRMLVARGVDAPRALTRGFVLRTQPIHARRSVTLTPEMTVGGAGLAGATLIIEFEQEAGPSGAAAAGPWPS